MVNTDSEIAKKADTSADVLNVVSVLVILAGIVLAAAAIWYGFDAREPWAWNGVVIDEDWKSITIGFVNAGLILIYTAAVWALLKLGEVIGRHIAFKHTVVAKTYRGKVVRDPDDV